MIPKSHLILLFSFFKIVQELRDRRKIRYLLSISNIPEDETTYFRDQLDKRLVRISSKPTVKRSVAVDGGEPVPTGVVRPGKENKASNGTKDVRGEQEKEQERDIVIMEDEIEALKLTVTSLRAQLSEQKKSYEETIQGLLHDRRTRMEEEKARKKYEADRIDDLTKKVEKLRVLCRENTRELLFTKKRAHTTEQKLVEEKTRLMDDVRALQNQVAEENRRNETAERVIEAKISRKHEGLVSELRSQLGKYEEDMRHIKTKSEAADLSNKKRLSYLQQRLESISSSHKSLQKRRHYEIEGFTNDILMLRKQLKTLEKTILKFGPLEDRECVLLNMAKETGDRAAKISTELQKLKHKVYEAENEMRSLAF